MKQSAFLNLNLRDAGKAFLVAVICAFLTALYTYTKTGYLPSTVAEWKNLLFTALSAGFAYLVKNFLSGATQDGPVSTPVDEYQTA